MQANSSPVISNQQGIHERLEEVVRRHMLTDFQRPIAEHAYQAWETLNKRWTSATPLVLDSGCGTAQSTRLLAAKYPDCLVVGVDRSLARLDRTQGVPDNALLLRTNLEDFWRLLSQYSVQLKAHYLLYPNPYPKAAQLRYRWHGSPVFSLMLGLSDELVLRSNWLLYLQEFESAASIARSEMHSSGVVALPKQAVPITVFEDKYQRSGQVLYELRFSTAVDGI